MGPKTLALKALCASLGRKYVGFRGSPTAPIWIVGEAPGADEDQAGVPFVGSSGRELDRMLAEAGIPLGLCCFTNPYKVRPPDNDIERISETGIAPQIFEEQFEEEIAEYKPSFIVPGAHRSLFSVDLPLTLVIKKVKSPNGEVLCLVVKDSLGLISSSRIFTLRISSENGPTETSLSLFLDDSRKSSTILSPTENTNPSPSES